MYYFIQLSWTSGVRVRNSRFSPDVSIHTPDYMRTAHLLDLSQTPPDYLHTSTNTSLEGASEPEGQICLLFAHTYASKYHFSSPRLEGSAKAVWQIHASVKKQSPPWS